MLANLTNGDIACKHAALDAGAADRDKAFYEGKIETAKWFARNRLPLLTAERVIAEATDDDIMRLPEEAF